MGIYEKPFELKGCCYIDSKRTVCTGSLKEKEYDSGGEYKIIPVRIQHRAVKTPPRPQSGNIFAKFLTKYRIRVASMSTNSQNGEILLELSNLTSKGRGMLINQILPGELDGGLTTWVLE